jgi:hypothetical protein
MKEMDNVLRILKETKIAMENEDALKIKNLSNQTINTASLTQDGDNIAVAVMIYSLGKIFERKDYKELPGWNGFYKIIISSLNSSIADAEKNDGEKFRKDLELIIKSIGKLSGKLKRYVQDVFQRARVNKASRIYEHGISMEKTANLLGVTLYELAEYAGKTGISDVPLGKTLNVKARIKILTEMFK